MTIFNKFKIPTILGLAIIFAGIMMGVFLAIKNQAFYIKASPDLAPENITIANITDSEVALSWQTSAPTISFITFGEKNPREQTVLDDRDTQAPEAHLLHYVTIKNLKPESSYLFKIVSGKLTSDTAEFKTATKASYQNGFGPIIGTVFESDKPLEEGVAYLSISNAITQSAIIQDMGNFLIPIALIRKANLSDIFQPNEDTVAKLTILSANGQSNVMFKLKPEGIELPPIRLGQNIDLTIESDKNLNNSDLNEDGVVNSIDYAYILQNFEKHPKDRKFDLNSDGVVDKKDADLILAEIQKSGNQ